MCGIVAVVRRPDGRPALDLRGLLRVLDDTDAHIEPLLTRPSVGGLNEIATSVGWVERQLRGARGTRALLADPVALAAFEHRAVSLTGHIAELDAHLDLDATDSQEIEALSAQLVAAKDALWALDRDRLRTARAVEALAGVSSRESNAIEAFHSIQRALP